jgi:hypothetical protein
MILETFFFCGCFRIAYNFIISWIFTCPVHCPPTPYSKIGGIFSQRDIQYQLTAVNLQCSVIIFVYNVGLNTQTRVFLWIFRGGLDYFNLYIAAEKLLIINK